MTITADFTGANKKMQALFRLEGGTKKALTTAKTATIQRAKYNVSNAILRVQTGHLKRNIGGYVQEREKGFFEVGIGTGNLIGREEVKYASVLEKGMTIHVKRGTLIRSGGSFRYIPFMTFPVSGVGPWRARGSKKQFRRAKQVTIRPRYWLSRSIQESEGYFMRALSPKNLLREMDYPERED